MDQSKAFLVSIIFAAAAMGLVYFWVDEQESQFKTSFGEYVPVVVAKKDIREFYPIRKENLKVITLPKKFAQPGYQSSIDAFDGTVASAPIKENEQVLSTKVYIKGKKTGLAGQVAISHRALSIPISNTTGVTKLVQPGDRVDIIAAIPYSTAKGQQTEIKTLLQNVHLLAVGEYIQNEIPRAIKIDPVTGKRKAVNLRSNRNFDTVSIEVSPVEAQNLVYVLENGADLYMTLRNPVDRTVVNVPTTTVDEVLGPDSKKAKRELASVPKPIVLPPPTTKVKQRKIKIAPVRSNPFRDGGGGFVQ